MQDTNTMGTGISSCNDISAWNAGCFDSDCDPTVATERFVAVLNQTLFNIITFSYAPGSDSLEVHKNGLLVDPLLITEITTTSFIIGEASAAGDIIVASALTGVTADVAVNVTNVSSESVVLIAAQQIVPFVYSIVGASVYIKGLYADNGRLIETVDYSVDVGNNSITLVDSYPAGTICVIVYNDSAVGGGIVSSADILDIANAINTVNKFAGKVVISNTNYHMLIATGVLAADTWIDQVDGAIITPIV